MDREAHPANHCCGLGIPVDGGRVPMPFGASINARHQPICAATLAFNAKADSAKDLADMRLMSEYEAR